MSDRWGRVDRSSISTLPHAVRVADTLLRFPPPSSSASWHELSSQQLDSDPQWPVGASRDSHSQACMGQLSHSFPPPPPPPVARHTEARGRYLEPARRVWKRQGLATASGGFDRCCTSPSRASVLSLLVMHPPPSHASVLSNL